MHNVVVHTAAVRFAPQRIIKELSNEKLSFKENGQEIAFISNQALKITNAEIRYKLSLGSVERGWFDLIPRATGNLSIIWRDAT